MTVQFAKHRAKFEAKLAQIHQTKLAIEGGDSPNNGHVHTWQKFRQTAKRDNDEYKGRDAYFIVKACTGCHEKHNLDYVVER